MTAPTPAPARPGFWATVSLLLKYARVRVWARRRHQQKLRKQRAGNSVDLGCIATPLVLLVALFVHGSFAMALKRAMTAGARVDLERSGRLLIVSDRVLRAVERAQRTEDLPEKDGERREAVEALNHVFWEAQRGPYRGEQARREMYDQYWARYEKEGAKGFVSERQAENLREVLSGHASPLASWLGALVLTWWFVMVTFQGEGLELDVQRRRHPMWEWLFSHPVRPGAVFFAEMIAPLSSNPNMMMAPIFWIVVLKTAGYDIALSAGAGLLIGLPLAAAASCLYKSLEIGALLRLAPRNRGAVLGLMGWVGFVSFFGAILMNAAGDLMETAARFLAPLGRLGDFPLVSCLLGFPGQEPNLGVAILAAWGLGLALVAAAVGLSARATARGLSGHAGGDAPTSVSMAPAARGWARDPLYRKELLWFWRDRGAVVQALLVPATLAGFQLFNLRALLATSHGSWSAPCAIAVIFGTYFLFVLGPKSLLSEGAALWITLTWPRGLESLLKAKARLWSILATVPVSLGMVLAAVLHPEAWWKVLLVALGWFPFSRSLAEKSVTLVQPASSSGEAEPIPQGRRYAAWLGTFTFASGVISQQWYLMATGVVYSAMTSAAMWQNFRARLPFLFDPWSERVPPPPTLLHAMVAIAGMTEVIAVFSAIAVAVGGKDGLWTAQAIAYGAVGLVTWLIMRGWLEGRGVSNRDVWRWGEPGMGLLPGCAIGAACGAALGVLAHGYLIVLGKFVPVQAEKLHRMVEYLAGHPAERVSLLVLSVVCAPLAEEYLFRGLLFRALDREWGGWRAVLGSACFFAIYHPPGAWLPVAALGTLNALLFRKARRLWPAVAAHACYNAVVSCW